jgi:hypothetical protein
MRFFAALCTRQPALQHTLLGWMSGHKLVIELM